MALHLESLAAATALGLVFAGLSTAAAETTHARPASGNPAANPCAIYGSGFVAVKTGGCTRIRDRVRIRREAAGRTEAPAAALGQPVPNGFHMTPVEQDGPMRAHVRVPGVVGGSAFAPLR